MGLVEQGPGVGLVTKRAPMERALAKLRRLLTKFTAAIDAALERHGQGQRRRRSSQRQVSAPHVRVSQGPLSTPPS